MHVGCYLLNACLFKVLPEVNAQNSGGGRAPEHFFAQRLINYIALRIVALL